MFLKFTIFFLLFFPTFTIGETTKLEELKAAMEIPKDDLELILKSAQKGVKDGLELGEPIPIFFYIPEKVKDWKPEEPVLSLISTEISHYAIPVITEGDITHYIYAVLNDEKTEVATFYSPGRYDRNPQPLVPYYTRLPSQNPYYEAVEKLWPKDSGYTKIYVRTAKAWYPGSFGFTIPELGSDNFTSLDDFCMINKIFAEHEFPIKSEFSREKRRLVRWVRYYNRKLLPRRDELITKIDDVIEEEFYTAEREHISDNLIKRLEKFKEEMHFADEEEERVKKTVKELALNKYTRLGKADSIGDISKNDLEVGEITPVFKFDLHKGYIHSCEIETFDSFFEMVRPNVKFYFAPIYENGEFVFYKFFNIMSKQFPLEIQALICPELLDPDIRPIKTYLKVPYLKVPFNFLDQIFQKEGYKPIFFTSEQGRPTEVYYVVPEFNNNNISWIPQGQGDRDYEILMEKTYKHLGLDIFIQKGDRIYRQLSGTCDKDNMLTPEELEKERQRYYMLNLFH